MKFIKQSIWKFLNLLHLGGIVQLFLKSGLKEDGWFRSFHTKESVDAKGNCLPWFNYAFIRFLESKLHKNISIFEYGSGNSTLWFASKVQSIKSVEHDQNWVNKLSLRLPANAKVVFQNLAQREIYINEIAAENKKYDMVIVDGRERNRCIEASLSYLSASGVIILDNSEREHYANGRQMLIKQGFKHLDFWGMPVGSAHNSCTSLYYKSENILGI